MSYDGFRPEIPPLHAPFWEALRSHRLDLQRCTDCGKFRFIPGEICPACHSTGYSWAEVSGRGRVYTYTIVHRAPTPAYQARVPYVIAHVELEEGPRLSTTLVGVDPAAVTVGMPVSVVFDDVEPDLTLYRFSPATGG